MRIGLFYGGRSFEHEISVITAVQAATFFPVEYELIPVYMKNGELFVKSKFRNFSSYVHGSSEKKAVFTKGGIVIKGRGFRKLDCALVATHGGEGENGILSGLLEYYEIPYTCCSPAACAICMDKKLTKSILTQKGFNTVKEVDPDNPEFPCIIKPRTLGSSIGIMAVRTGSEFPEKLKAAKSFGSVLCEQYLEGASELNCAAITVDGNVMASAVEQPLYGGSFLDFDSKYKGGAKRELPANISEELTQTVKRTTCEIYKSLELFGAVRIDYLYKDEKLYVNEINSVPGSLAYYLFSEEGLPFSALLRKLINEGIMRGTAKPMVYSLDVLRDYCNGASGTKNSSIKN